MSSDSNSDFNKVFDLTKEISLSSVSPIAFATLKVMEECGELAAEVLKQLGHKKSEQTDTETLARIKEEGVDAIIAVLDVLNTVDVTKEEIIVLTESALDKWKKKHLQV